MARDYSVKVSFSPAEKKLLEDVARKESRPKGQLLRVIFLNKYAAAEIGSEGREDKK